MAESRKKIVAKTTHRKPTKTVTKKRVAKKVPPKKVVKKKTIPKSIAKTKAVTKKKAVKKTIKKSVKKAVKKVTKKKIPAKKVPVHKKELLKRHHENPIVEPNKNSPWESRATFNPSALVHDGVIHIVYRAMGDSDVSVLGYAKSPTGLSFKNKSDNAVYAHWYKRIKEEKPSPIMYCSGGGLNGGCEDPRLTHIDDRVYMTYTAFDGWGSVRVALTSISINDFIANIWNWKEPVLISAPNEVHKNWVLFPEKINGSYALLHAISPEIFIDYIDDLDRLDGTTFINSIHQGSSSWKLRERGIRGIGPAPIKTPAGWLVFYHATEEKDPNRYKIFAMLLDLKDPTKILHRSRQPILEPDEQYENNGHKSGVVYSCGAVVKDGLLFVYYGGADTVTCVAVANLKTFLKELTTVGISRLKKQKK